jgi:hypothetical protein
MNVVSLDPKIKQDEQRKQVLLEVVDEIRKQIEEGNIKEFVACSTNEEGECQIHISCLDTIGGVGMFEIGKHLLIQIQN